MMSSIPHLSFSVAEVVASSEGNIDRRRNGLPGKSYI